MEYIWISRWEEFQHYRPERDRAPAWIKEYPKQLDDDRYLMLSSTQRGLLADLRQMFSIARASLQHSRSMISARRNVTTYQRDIDALDHAGFIEVISRETLEQRLEKLYSSPRAPARARRGEKLEVENSLPSFTEQPKNSRPYHCPVCATSFRGKTTLAEHVYHSHDGPVPEHWVEAETRAAT